MENKEDTASTRPELWSPSVAIGLSLIFTSIFGSYFISRNWRSIGNKQKAVTAKKWLYASILVAVFTVLAIPDKYALGVSFWWIIIWYFFSSAKTQHKYVTEQYGNNYRKQSWLKPLGIATALLFGAAIAFTAISTLMPGLVLVKPGSSTDKISLDSNIIADRPVLLRPGINDLGLKMHEFIACIHKSYPRAEIRWPNDNSDLKTLDILGIQANVKFDVAITFIAGEKFFVVREMELDGPEGVSTTTKPLEFFPIVRMLIPQCTK